VLQKCDNLNSFDFNTSVSFQVTYYQLLFQTKNKRMTVKIICMTSYAKHPHATLHELHARMNLDSQDK
jgi:hypothetical protein